jgi:hypothetical protein
VQVQDKDGRIVEADLIICPQCGKDGFNLFRIKGHNHIHLQCLGCEMSFCPMGEDYNHEEADHG